MKLTGSFTELLCPLGHQCSCFALFLCWERADSRVWGRTVEMRDRPWSPLVVVGSPEEVIEDLENDGDATPRMADATAALTARGQSAWWDKKRAGEIGRE